MGSECVFGGVGAGRKRQKSPHKTLVFNFGVRNNHAARMDLTEKNLASLGGWPVLKEARGLVAGGRVLESITSETTVRGKVVAAGRTYSAGLRFVSPSHVENLCSCHDSRVRGVICAHSIAVALGVGRPAQAPAVVVAPKSASQDITEEIPQVRFSFEGSLRHVEAAIAFDYSTPGAANPAEEQRAASLLLSMGFENAGSHAVLKGEAAILRFVATHLPQLRSQWQVTQGERFSHVTRDLVALTPHFAIRDKSDGWLDFHVHFSAGSELVISAPELQRLFQSGQTALSLGGGRRAILNPALLADLNETLRDCDPTQERGAYRVRACQRGYLEASIATWTESEAAAIHPKGSLGPLRENLRPYQVEGALWMLDRAHRQDAGLLADEMGLGKTVQSLAMLEAMPGPHLIVCPSSLVWNWRSEAQKFTPSLRVLCIEGPQRVGLFARIAEHDIIITSYALLRRDVDLYSSMTFSTAILDEAQHVKNPDSQSARAVRTIRARARFILTGTPLENAIRDLWSLFAFLLPGYLGSAKDFQDRYEKPLAESGCAEIKSRLTRRIAPYMLRRRKADILKELPDKLEQIIEVEMTSSQKSAYTQLQIAARANVDALREQPGAARMQVLTALLRLRQAACDLRLLGIDSEEPSAKLDALSELLNEASDGGHRTLVFSQFTSMLDLIAAKFETEGRTFCRLDGATRDRQSVVNRFQTDPNISVFLISLKAGGVGLNLTAADTVIHFDPWWNPAVEAQATDRAHRIGQTKVVTTIKLIARETVEARVLAMQLRKKTLLSDLLEAGPSALSAEEFADLVG